MEFNQPVLENFKVKIAVDTQILAYLVDKTYPSLNFFFELLLDCPFVDVVCSRFVTYEFIGVRKLEHYLRAIHAKTTATGGVMNFNSVLRYKGGWSAPELKYEDVYLDIKAKVEADLKAINDDYGIEYSEGWDQSLWLPHQDLVLSSKISKEDSLALLSTLIPDGTKVEKNLIFLTNDDAFYRAFCTDMKMPSVDNVFAAHGITKPQLHKLSDIKMKAGKKIDLLIAGKTKEQIGEFIVEFLLEQIKDQNKELMLGTVTACPKSMAGKLLCFVLVAEELKANHFVTIISNKLEFIFSPEVALKDFHNVNVGQINNYPYKPDGSVNSENISVELKDGEGNFLNAALYTELTKKGNLIFIHPDSVI